MYQLACLETRFLVSALLCHYRLFPKAVLRMLSAKCFLAPIIRLVWIQPRYRTTFSQNQTTTSKKSKIFMTMTSLVLIHKTLCNFLFFRIEQPKDLFASSPIP